MAVPLPLDSSKAAFNWFTEYHRGCILKNGTVPEWFHGIISRKAAEEMLMCKPTGYFLIRVSESRVGYTLSYRAEDRCRHFMIDILPDDQFIIVGDTMHYCSLHDLVAFHRRNPILPYNELLTVACKQGGNSNYAELLFPEKKDVNHGWAEWINPSTQTNTPQSNISDRNPASQLQKSTSHSARLYPSLETEMSTLNIQSTDQPIKPVPKPRTIFRSKSPTEEMPPQLPPRMCLPSRPQTTTEDRSQGLMPVNPDRQKIAPDTPSEGRTQQKSQQQLKPVVLSLAHIKKKLKKKRSEDHTYEEITKDQEDAQHLGDNDYEELPECPPSDCITNLSEDLPLEYLNPSPFAPGY